MSSFHSNRYELLDKIAKGGMAEVYRARRLGTRGYDALVAVKRILPERSEDTNFVEMLIDEARITAQLKHPNIAQLYELACDETGYFLVMELLLGPNFAALIDKLKVQGRHLPQACAIEVVIQLLRALDYAHNKRDASGRPLNLVHRDISPDNLLLGPRGEVKLIDFGVAKAKDRLADKTKAGMIKGKFSYLAPERLRTTACDGRADLFSAALVLWEALAGRIRFDAEDDRELIEQIEANQAPSFREMDVEIAPQLEAILDRALRTRPDERYQTAAEFLDALERYQRRFNPEDNTARLGKLVASSFKEELRWLEEARLKFQEGRLKPLCIVGGGIVEERFQLSKRLTSSQKPTQHQLKLPSARRSSPSPFGDLPPLDSQRRIETNIFADHGIELLEDDFEEFEEVSDPRGRLSLPMAAPEDIPKTELSPAPEFSRSKRAMPRMALSVPESEQKTKTRVFEFGKGRRWGFQIDYRVLAILAAALVGGFLIFAILLQLAGVSPALPEPPTLPAPQQAAAPAVPASGAPRNLQANQPSPRTMDGPLPPARPGATSAIDATPLPAMPPPPAQPMAEAAAPTAAVQPHEAPKPKPKRKAKKKSAKASKRKSVPKKRTPPRQVPIEAVEDDFFESDDLEVEGDFFESDDLAVADEDDFEQEAPAVRQRQTAQSAADEAFNDF